MGNILNTLKICGSGYPEIEEDFLVFLDFEGIQLGQNRDVDEMETDQEALSEDFSSRLQQFLFDSEGVLAFMRTYQTSPNKNIQQIADNNVLEVLKVRIFELQRSLSLSDEIENLVPALLNLLLTSTDALRENNEILLQFGRILDIAMQYDEMKLASPGLQNDISFVKRQLVVRDDFGETFGGINLDKLAFFYIKPAPLLQSVIESSTNFFKNPDQNKPLDIVVSFCKICIGILSTDLRSKFQRAGTVGLVQRVMVATALLYDHLSSTGLFVKDCPINVKKIVNILQLEAGLNNRRGSFGSKDQELNKVDRTSIQEVQVTQTIL